MLYLLNFLLKININFYIPKYWSLPDVDVVQSSVRHATIKGSSSREPDIRYSVTDFKMNTTEDSQSESQAFVADLDLKRSTLTQSQLNKSALHCHQLLPDLQYTTTLDGKRIASGQDGKGMAATRDDRIVITPLDGKRMATAPNGKKTTSTPDGHKMASSIPWKEANKAYVRSNTDCNCTSNKDLHKGTCGGSCTCFNATKEESYRPSKDDLRDYAYEGEGSTPGSLSSCCSGEYCINVSLFISILLRVIASCAQETLFAELESSCVIVVRVLLE